MRACELSIHCMYIVYTKKTTVTTEKEEEGEKKMARLCKYFFFFVCFGLCVRALFAHRLLNFITSETDY